WVARSYKRRYAAADAEVQWAFVRRLRPLAIMEGVFWGASVWLFFHRIPLVEQFGCWVVLAINSPGPLTRLGFVPRLLKGYTCGLFMVALAGVANSMRVSPLDHFSLWFIALILFQWFNMQYQTKAFFKDQSEHFGLQYDLARKERQAQQEVKLRNRFLAVAT